MALGLPSIDISFKQKAIQTIQRGARGIVGLVLQDTNSLGHHTIYDSSDILSDITEDNKRYIQDALIGYTKMPLRIEVYILNSGAEPNIQDALDFFENVRFDYLAYPYASGGDNTTITSWIKTMRDEGTKVSAVLANNASDNEGIVNFTQGNIEVGEDTFEALEYTPRIAGLICGTDATLSITYANLPEVTNIPSVKKRELETKIGNGELVLFKEAGKIKIARGVTSLTTTTDTKGVAFQKIKLVGLMDMISNDVRETVRDVYIGKYANSYDNKVLLMTAIRNYLDTLISEGLIEANSVTVDINMEEQKKYLKSIGVDINKLNEQQIKMHNTGDKVFLIGYMSVLDAIEEVKIDFII